MKVLIFLCSLALSKAGVIETAYSSAPSVSTVYSSLNAPVLTKTISTPIVTKLAPISYTKTYSAPAPVYESVLSTHQSRTNSLDGSQHDSYSKALDTAYSSLRKYDSRTTNNGVLLHSSPAVHSGSVISQPQLAYSVQAPLVHTVSSPVTYTTHAQVTPVVTKTISAPAVGTYSGQVQPVKITYSEAPLVSHMSFTGLGTSYSW